MTNTHNNNGMWGRERETWNAGAEGEGDGVNRPSAAVFRDRGRITRGEPNEVNLGIIITTTTITFSAPLMSGQKLGRGREVSRVLEPERDPSEEEEEEEEEREGMGFIQEQPQWRRYGCCCCLE